MSTEEFPTTDETTLDEKSAVSEPLPSLACLEFRTFSVKVEPDQNYRYEVWREGDTLPLDTQMGFQAADAAMLAGLIWLKAHVLENFAAVQIEIDKRTP